jgi:hypothetical protein
MGAKFEANTQRPYFQGHERNDVVNRRNEFIGYFLTHKDFYYNITDGDMPMWTIPTKSPRRILMCMCKTQIFLDIIFIRHFFHFYFN